MLVLEPLLVSGVLGPDSGEVIREAEVLGWKGAAFAAFGEMVVDFFGADAPLPASKDGVKLGESTLNRFLLLRPISIDVGPLRIRRLTSLTAEPNWVSEGHG